jgi:hypothetical protein
LDQTRNHERILTNVFQDLGLDPEEDSPDRQVTKLLGNALVQAMNMAPKAGDPAAAELVACECVVALGVYNRWCWLVTSKRFDAEPTEQHEIRNSGRFGLETLSCHPRSRNYRHVVLG